MSGKYQRLVSEQAASMGMSPLPVVMEETGNASTDGQNIFLNLQWMTELESTAGEGGVRFVLAHELGHVADGMGGGHSAELSADAFAARSLARSGHDAGAIDAVGTKLNDTASATHPAASQRVSSARSTHSHERETLHFMKKESVTRSRLQQLPPRQKADRNRNTREHAL